MCPSPASSHRGIKPRAASPEAVEQFPASHEVRPPNAHSYASSCSASVLLTIRTVTRFLLPAILEPSPRSGSIPAAIARNLCPPDRRFQTLPLSFRPRSRT